MPLEVTFELSDKDLDFLCSKAAVAYGRTLCLDEDALIATTRDAFMCMQHSDAPRFVTERADKLKLLIEMLEDQAWLLTGEDRERVVKAIAYFAEPDDLIPDAIPGLGFLDDAIMIELVVRELEHEIEAYEDFCVAVARGYKAEGEMSSHDWLAIKREELHERMQRRRRRRNRGRGGSGGMKSPFDLF